MLPIIAALLGSGCQKSGETWDSVKTAGRYLNRGIDQLAGKEYDSQWLANADQFVGPADADFIPLNDADLRAQFQLTDMAVMQPRYSPGEHGIPTLDRFSSPIAQLQQLFKTIRFDTDDHIVRNKIDLLAIQKIAEYMKQHPNTLLSIEGHCDERASAAYNLALGTRRANQIRILLMRSGADHNRLYTISYGKEKPVALGHEENDWQQNRRVQFKLFER